MNYTRIGGLTVIHSEGRVRPVATRHVTRLTDVTSNFYGSHAGLGQARTTVDATEMHGVYAPEMHGVYDKSINQEQALNLLAPHEITRQKNYQKEGPSARV